MAEFTLKYIKDHLQNKLYPYTYSDAVYTDNEESKTLTDSLFEINRKINDVAVHSQADWNETDNTTNSYIKNKPASLPANGGNADTVDGKHANEFVGNEHLTSLESHKSLFDEKLSIDIANPLIKNITFDSSTGIITVTRLNNTTFTINIPKSLVFSSALFDDVTSEIVITWSDDSKSRIPVDGLIDVYTGSENDVIQIVVNDENIISATVKSGSITRALLSADIQTDLDNSHTHINKEVIDRFSEDAYGNVLYNGTSISAESGMTDYTDLTNKPLINNVELIGNKSLSDLGIESIGSADSALTTAKAYTDSAASSKVGIEHLTNHVKPDGNTIIAASDGTLSTQYINKISITSGADLNDYSNLGFYTCEFNSSNGELGNRPTNHQFGMVVYPTFDRASVCQLITENLVTPKTFFRIMVPAQNIFGDWKRIYTTADPPPTTNNLLATVSGTPLDAVQGKALDDKITSQNVNFANSLAEVNRKLPPKCDIRVGSAEITCQPNALSTVDMTDTILNAFNWSAISVLIPVLHSSIPHVLSISNMGGTFYVYNNGGTQYDNVTVFYIAVGY